MKPLAFLFRVVAPALLACAASAQEDYAAVRGHVLRSTVARLQSLAEWCEGVELQLEREKLLRKVLALDPGNADAHRALKHRLAPDGSWIAPTEPSKAKNYRPAELGAFKKRYDKTIAPACAEIWDASQREGLTQQQVGELHALILELDPDEPRVRALRGETRHKDRWILLETARALEARPRIRKAMELARTQEHTLVQTPPTELEAGLGLAWDACIDTPNARVLIRGEIAHGRLLAQYVEASVQAFAEVLGGKAQLPERAIYYVLCNPAEATAFCERYPGLGAEERRTYPTYTSIGLPPGSRVGIWLDDPSRRLDLIVRQTLTLLLHAECKLTAQRGSWAAEGLGLYLTRELIGTRSTWFVDASRWSNDAQELRDKLHDPAANWMQLGAELLATDPHPTLKDVLESDLASLDGARTLYAYVLAAYVLEAHPDIAPRLLRRIGESTAPADVLHEELAIAPAELEGRMRRWIGERASVQ